MEDCSFDQVTFWDDGGVAVHGLQVLKRCSQYLHGERVVVVQVRYQCCRRRGSFAQLIPCRGSVDSLP